MMITMIFHLKQVVEGGAVRVESDRHAPGGVGAPIVQQKRESAREGHVRVDLRLLNHQKLQQESTARTRLVSDRKVQPTATRAIPRARIRHTAGRLSD